MEEKHTGAECKCRKQSETQQGRKKIQGIFQNKTTKTRFEEDVTSNLKKKVLIAHFVSNSDTVCHFIAAGRLQKDS